MKPTKINNKSESAKKRELAEYQKTCDEALEKQHIYAKSRMDEYKSYIDVGFEPDQAIALMTATS